MAVIAASFFPFFLSLFLFFLCVVSLGQLGAKIVLHGSARQVSGTMCSHYDTRCKMCNVLILSLLHTLDIEGLAMHAIGVIKC